MGRGKARGVRGVSRVLRVEWQMRGKVAWAVADGAMEGKGCLAHRTRQPSLTSNPHLSPACRRCAPTASPCPGGCDPPSEPLAGPRPRCEGQRCRDEGCTPPCPPPPFIVLPRPPLRAPDADMGRVRSSDDPCVLPEPGGAGGDAAFCFFTYSDTRKETRHGGSAARRLSAHAQNGASCNGKKRDFRATRGCLPLVRCVSVND